METNLRANDLEFNYDDTNYYIVVDQDEFMNHLNMQSMLGKHLNLDTIPHNKIYFRRPNINPGDVLIAVRNCGVASLLDAWFEKERPLSEPI